MPKVLKLHALSASRHDAAIGDVDFKLMLINAAARWHKECQTAESEQFLAFLLSRFATGRNA
ncbi:MAG: hypothetical protein ACOY99_07545 [Pseudomonadota bacterium]